MRRVRRRIRRIRRLLPLLAHLLTGFRGVIVEARKLEHQYPHALKVEYRDPSTNPPKPMFQLSRVHFKTG